MIFSLLIIHNHHRISSITRVLHATTWDFFTSRRGLPFHFCRSSKVVKEAIMTDIDDLVQEFRRTSSNVGASFFPMLGLLKVLHQCIGVCLVIISVCCLSL
jgi:hypothetical protein